MAVTLVSTGIQFPDSTIQTTAAGAGGVTSLNGQTGAIDNTTQYAIGSYVLGRPANETTYNNSTVAGSSLYAMPTSAAWLVNNESQGVVGFGCYATNAGQATSLVNTGSWRCVSIAGQGRYAQYRVNAAGLWVRYA